MDSEQGPLNVPSIEEYQTKERSGNFTTEEVERLKGIIDKYKHILMCKLTDGTSSKQKETAWRNIVMEYNAVGATPRTVKQLKYKFENMKRSAKKDASRERQEMRRTGGGKPPSLPPGSEDATDWLRSVMSGSIDGDEAICDDDVIVSKWVTKPKLDQNISIKSTEGNEDWHFIEQSEETEETLPDPDARNATLTSENNINEKVSNFDYSSPHSSLKKPMAPPLKRLLKRKSTPNNDNVIKKTLREKKMSVLDSLHSIELEKIKESVRQQKELHEQILRHNEEKHKLELRKLQLEIDLLELKKKENENKSH